MGFRCRVFLFQLKKAPGPQAWLVVTWWEQVVSSLSHQYLEHFQKLRTKMQNGFFVVSAQKDTKLLLSLISAPKIFRHHCPDSGSACWCSVFVPDGSGDRKTSRLPQHWPLNIGVRALSVSKYPLQSSKALEKIPLPCNRNEIMRVSEKDFHAGT